METRMRILFAAERLLAEHGVDAVPLREVNRVAGQRNSSALHYHFGSRDALIEAIVAYRMPPVNQRRLVLLREGDFARRSGDISFLAWTMVQPLADLVEQQGDDNHWVRFLAQIYSSSRFNLAVLVRREAHDTSLRQLARKVRAALPDVPHEIMNQRLIICMRQVVHGLADWQRGVLEPQGGALMGDFQLFVANLVDMSAAALAAPVSPAARDLLSRVSRRTSERLSVVA